MESVSDVRTNNLDNEKAKMEKRILYFSDGAMVVDNEEESETQTDSIQPVVDAKHLGWAPWFWYQTVHAGTKTLQVCDYLGETLASFFGITTPKYQFEINEYHRIKKAEEEAKKEKDLEMGGWTATNNESNSIFPDAVSTPPRQMSAVELMAVTDQVIYNVANLQKRQPLEVNQVAMALRSL